MFVTLFYWGPAPAQGKAKTQAAPAAFLPKGFSEAYIWHRVDLGLQQAYMDALAANDSSRRVDCFVRDENKINPGDRDFLASNGFNIRSVGGN